MNALLKTAPIALALMLGLAAPAKADLVIKGRSAQALHCAAMLFMVSDTLYEAGYVKRSVRDTAQYNAVKMLNYVPGTQAEKVQAMKQRFGRLIYSRSMPQLLAEYNKTAKWCNKAFL